MHMKEWRRFFGVLICLQGTALKAVIWVFISPGKTQGYPQSPCFSPFFQWGEGLKTKLFQNMERCCSAFKCIEICKHKIISNKTKILPGHPHNDKVSLVIVLKEPFVTCNWNTKLYLSWRICKQSVFMELPAKVNQRISPWTWLFKRRVITPACIAPSFGCWGSLSVPITMPQLTPSLRNTINTTTFPLFA